MDQILDFIGRIVAYGGPCVVFAFLLFRFLGKSWIENKFAQRLDQHRHELSLDLQKFRVEVDSKLSGALKIQDKEFETLPEAWRRLSKAFDHVSALTYPSQIHPNLDEMTEDRLVEFLESSNLRPTEKQEILQAENKVQTYVEAIFWHKYIDVRRACLSLYRYVALHGIFFPLK